MEEAIFQRPEIRRQLSEKSDNPDVLYGRDFDDEFISIRDIAGEMGEVTIRGQIINTDSRLLKSGKPL